MCEEFLANKLRKREYIDPQIDYFASGWHSFDIRLCCELCFMLHMSYILQLKRNTILCNAVCAVCVSVNAYTSLCTLRSTIAAESSSMTLYIGLVAMKTSMKSNTFVIYFIMVRRRHFSASCLIVLWYIQTFDFINFMPRRACWHNQTIAINAHLHPPKCVKHAHTHTHGTYTHTHGTNKNYITTRNIYKRESILSAVLCVCRITERKVLIVQVNAPRI